MGSQRKKYEEPGVLFTLKQQKAIMAMIQNASILQHVVNQISMMSTIHKETLSNPFFLPLTSIKCNLCVLDTKETNNVYHPLSFFQTYIKIKHVLITLPNGNQITTNISGTVIFSPSFYLTKVLYIPTFIFNLISILKLTNTLPCNLIFSATKCHT